MGFLDKFGRGVEDVAGRAKSRFSNDVEPIEIASKLRETMDKRAASFARDRSVVPNVFRIHLAPADFQRVVSWSQDEMARQMEEVATSHAADQGYSFVGPVEVTFVSDDSLGSPVEILDIGGQRYLLTGPVTVIGRGSEADIIVDDSGVSRRHLEIRLMQGHAIATDLHSTNGTFVEGHRVDAATLLDGNTLTVGRTRIMFWDGTQGVGANG